MTTDDGGGRGEGGDTYGREDGRSDDGMRLGRSDASAPASASGFADVVAAAAAAAESRVAPGGGGNLGGMDAFIAKTKSDAGSSVTYGSNGSLVVTPKSRPGGADARFTGTRQTSRFASSGEGRIRGRGGSGGGSGVSDKRAFGAGGTGPTSNSTAASRASSGQARRADSAPYGINMRAPAPDTQDQVQNPKPYTPTLTRTP